MDIGVIIAGKAGSGESFETEGCWVGLWLNEKVRIWNFLQQKQQESDVVVHTCSPRTPETEAGGYS